MPPVQGDSTLSPRPQKWPNPPSREAPSKPECKKAHQLSHQVDILAFEFKEIKTLLPITITTIGTYSHLQHSTAATRSSPEVLPPVLSPAMEGQGDDVLSTRDSFIEELQRFRTDPRQFSHLPSECRALSNMRGTSSHGLDCIPTIKLGALATLILSPDEVLRPEVHCPSVA